MAAVHNVRLASCAPLQQFVADKLDCVVYNRETPPAGLVRQLLHLDQPWPTAAVAAAVDTATGGDSAAAEPMGFGLRVRLHCPKVGVAFSMQPPAAALPHPPTREPRPCYVQLTLLSVSVDLEPSGALPLGRCGQLGRHGQSMCCVVSCSHCGSLPCRALPSTAPWPLAHASRCAGALVVEADRLVCGPCDSPVGAVPRHRKILSAPSSVCRSVCKAADFFQYAVHGTVAEGARRVGLRGAVWISNSGWAAWIRSRSSCGSVAHACPRPPALLQRRPSTRSARS